MWWVRGSWTRLLSGVAAVTTAVIESRSEAVASVRQSPDVALTCGNVLARIPAYVMPMTGGQGVASSNLASPTKRSTPSDLV
jgi:hypothetical protein